MQLDEQNNKKIHIKRSKLNSYIILVKFCTLCKIEDILKRWNLLCICCQYESKPVTSWIEDVNRKRKVTN